MNDDSVWPIALRTNDQSRLLTTAFDRPSLCWRLEARRDAVQQRAYELQRAPDAGFSAFLSSGRVETASVVGATWIGDPLESREVAFLRVRVWTDRGVTQWSEALRVEGGLDL